MFLLIASSITFAELSIIISDALVNFIEAKYGVSAKTRILKWQSIIQNNKNIPTWKKLNLVNNFFNQIPYATDLDHWHTNDYWATPIEFLATNGGDCEDYAIAKYFTLVELGVPTEKLRITYVIDQNSNQAHMVLTYYETQDADPLVLDNIKPSITYAANRDDLQPVYSFNGEGLWLAKDRGTMLHNDASEVTAWSSMNDRLAAEMKLSFETAAGSAGSQN